MEDDDRYCEDNGHHDWEAMGYGDRRCSKCGKMDYAESEDDFHRRIYGQPKDSEA